MMILYGLIAIVAAGLNSFQAGANAQLSKSLNNPILAALILYTSSVVLVSITLLISSFFHPSHLPGKQQLLACPWWAWMGGALGIAYVFAMLTIAGKLGSGVFGALTLSTGIITSVCLDHFALVGFRQHPLNIWRTAGCLLMVGGAVLIAKF